MKNFKIVTISNWYKDTLNNCIDNSDPESLDLPELIDERFCNAPMAKDNLVDLSKKIA